MSIANWDCNDLRVSAVNVDLMDFVIIDFAHFDEGFTSQYDKFFYFRVVIMVTTSDARLGGGK